MGTVDLEDVKTVHAKGRVYLYFNTGMKRAGKPVYTRLPDTSDPAFGTAYATATRLKTMRESKGDQDDQITMAMLADRYQRSPKFTNRAEKTQRIYVYYLRRIIDQCGDAPINDLTRGDIRELLNPLKPSAQRMMLNVAHVLFQFANANDWTTGDPTDGIVIEIESTPHAEWPEALVKAALADPETRLPVALLLYTGQRIGDVCKMRWGDIEDGDTIYVKQEKTGTELWIPMHDALRAIMDAEQRGLTTILRDDKGRQLKTDTLRQRLQKWARGKGAKIVPHGLRKNAVNALLEAGCTVGEVASITGQSLQMVEHYARKMNRKGMAKKAIGKWNAS